MNKFRRNEINSKKEYWRGVWVCAFWCGRVIQNLYSGTEFYGKWGTFLTYKRWIVGVKAKCRKCSRREVVWLPWLHGRTTFDRGSSMAKWCSPICDIFYIRVNLYLLIWCRRKCRVNFAQGVKKDIISDVLSDYLTDWILWVSWWISKNFSFEDKDNFCLLFSHQVFGCIELFYGRA